MKSKFRWMAMMMMVIMMLGGCGGERVTDNNEEAAGNNSKPVIRVGSILALGTAAPFVAKEKGLFENSDFQIELSEFADGSALMEAFAAGELDVALGGIGPVTTWIAKGVGMKIVASANGGGHVLMTRKDSGITSLEDLKGKKIAEPNIATVTDTLLRSKILGDANLKPDTDVTLVSGMKPADMANVLMATKEVEAIITWEPFASQAIKEYGEDIVTLYDSPKVIKEETGRNAFYPVNVVAVSQSFIDDRSGELEGFMKIYKETIDFLNRDASANQILAAVLKLEEEVINDARERIDYVYEIDKEASLETLQWAFDLGYIESIPKSEELFDERFLNTNE